jgi:hypothetical protein
LHGACRLLGRELVLEARVSGRIPSGISRRP